MRFRVIYDRPDDQWVVVDLGRHGRTHSIHATEQAAHLAAQQAAVRCLNDRSALQRLGFPSRRAG